MKAPFDARRSNGRPGSRSISAVSKVRRLVVILLVALAPTTAAEGAELLGELALRIDDDARVTADARPRDGRFVLSVSHQSTGLTAQLLAAAHPLIDHWSILPRSDAAEWVELRLAPRVRGVHVDRPAPGRLVLRFTDNPVAAAAVAARAEASRRETDSALNARRDRPLRRILRKQTTPAPTVARVGPLRFPVGVASPVRLAPTATVPPRPFGSVPEMVRGAWAADPRFAESVRLADGGDVTEAVAALRAARVADDPSRALLSLARGHAWSRPRGDGEPTHPGWAADAYLSAVGMYPDADWTPWARGQAAYSLWRDLRFAEAIVQARLASDARPMHPDRAWWEVLAGHARIAQGDTDAGLDALASFADGLPELDVTARFEARKAVALALWRAGDPARAAAVVDLLLADHPRLAADPKLDRDFVRMYLDAGRKDGARPRLERLRTQAPEKVDRERARWWLQELALMEGDEEGARVVLVELLERHPGSVLAPMARVRLAVLEAMARTNRYDVMGGAAGPPWPTLALDLRRVALQWPRTPVEDDALSIVAQIWLHLDLLIDGLELVEWLAERTPGHGGPTDHHALICEHAPRLVSSLLERGELTRGLGRFRMHLDDDRYAACISPDLEDRIVDAAVDADLVGFAVERLTRSITRGASARRLADQLVRVAALQRDAGRLRVAERTLDYVRDRALPIDGGAAELARADLHSAAGRADEALRGYARAEASGASRGRLAARRARALEMTGEYRAAAEELATAVTAETVEEPGEAHLHLADLRRRTARSEAEWTAVLEELDRAEPGRTADWIRTDALLALGRDAELEPVLGRLASESDAFGHWARELTSAADFERSLDALLQAASNP